MRKNLTKVKILEGKITYGVFVPLLSPTIVEMIGHIGFDFVLLDGEHSPLAAESCEAMVRAAECVNITPLIRVAENVRQNILRYLDIGALGVQMPMINSQTEAQSVIDAVKYPPYGKRGLAGVRAANYGLKGSLGDYVAEANRETMIIIQIETMLAVDNLKEILATPGPDVIFIGPTDLSSAMGYPGQVNHPEVQKMIEYIVKEIRAAGKAAGTVAYDLPTLRKCKERGFQYIVYSVGPMLVRAGREYLEVARGE
ncbi:MAG: aldolase/citrate lyase family protein [Dehalococcoidales bacterium]|nr:aldolase/citrate lyase family protein [Dehalococcoidales bacterium]